MENYDDIINLPHHVSATHSQMSLIDRAAQFSPFAAVVGYAASVKETARLTNRRVELDEYEKDALNEKLNIVAEHMEERPEITITYFKPDDKKAGGVYVTVTGCVKKMDDYEHIVCLTDGAKVPIEEIIEIASELTEQ